ncbi:MAG: para-aminobenzoate synthase [Chitinophagales bacterium]|nr:MAG: para-aminobenzoate synthase [Chitinophagales bacterium]
MRHIIHLSVPVTGQLKAQILNWADTHFHTAAYFDNNHYSDYAYHTYEALIACGSRNSLCLQAGNAFARLQSFYAEHNDWLIGFLAYDLKNEIEHLSSSHTDVLGFPDLFFFQPEWIIELKEQQLIIHAPDAESARQFAEFIAMPVPEIHPIGFMPQLIPRITREHYLQIAEAILSHIRRGDIYEINFCQEFYAEDVNINPITIFRLLNAECRAPFSAYVKCGDKYVISASPERFLKKTADRLVSMPMKGTAPRGFCEDEDVQRAVSLKTSAKERSENVMIVDLVRNDLSKSCQPGSVQVEELCGIKTFPGLHQMVSTISGKLNPKVHFTEAIRNAFPMGSMTGAPKVKAMELIERYEWTRRGLYSGSLGYITPEGDFDFNVVIRTLLYNSANRYLSYHTGSAITADSDPEQEYHECLLKAQALTRLVAFPFHSVA